MEKMIVPLVVCLIILIVLFLVLREVACWYWKINERIALQNDTNNLLKKILNQQNITTSQLELSNSGNKKLFCSSCGKEYIDPNATICESCGSKL